MLWWVTFPFITYSLDIGYQCILRVFTGNRKSKPLAPKKSGNIINNFGATTFTTTKSTGVTPTYLVTNLIADTYFRAKITNGACSEVYTDAVLYNNGTLAIGGSISSDTSSICSGSATTLTLVGSVGTIAWQKSTNYFTNPSAATWLILTGTATDVSTGNLNSSTAYRAKVTIGSCSTVDSENVFTVTVNKAVAKAIKTLCNQRI